MPMMTTVVSTVMPVAMTVMDVSTTTVMMMATTTVVNVSSTTTHHDG